MTMLEIHSCGWKYSIAMVMDQFVNIILICEVICLNSFIFSPVVGEDKGRYGPKPILQKLNSVKLGLFFILYRSLILYLNKQITKLI